MDGATWTNDIKDEALRQALREYDDALIYESDFTVVTAGEEQDVSSVPDLGRVLAVAWPWQTHDDWKLRARKFRIVDQNTIRLLGWVRPVAGDVLRLRHTRLHHIEDLDGAAATTVQEPAHRAVVGLGAAAWAIDVRLRQITENPAIPDAAAGQLRQLRDDYRDRFDRALAGVERASPVAWEDMGL